MTYIIKGGDSKTMCMQPTEAKKPTDNKKVVSKNMPFVIGLVLFVSMIVIGTASASITTDIDNFTTIIGNNTYGITGWVVNMMGLFLLPPMVYFVVMGIFVTIIGITAGLLLRRGRRR